MEQIIRERDRVAQEIKDGSHAEMEKLGIVVDALEIQEIEDSSGYIKNLAAPHAAAVASRQAGAHYGLETVASNIEDVEHNITRFAVVGDQPRFYAIIPLT